MALWQLQVLERHSLQLCWPTRGPRLSIQLGSRHSKITSYPFPWTGKNKYLQKRGRWTAAVLGHILQASPISSPIGHRKCPSAIVPRPFTQVLLSENVLLDYEAEGQAVEGSFPPEDIEDSFLRFTECVNTEPLPQSSNYLKQESCCFGLGPLLGPITSLKFRRYFLLKRIVRGIRVWEAFFSA